MPNKIEKVIGVYYGSFDPVHNMHLYFAKSVLQDLPVTEIHFIPILQTIKQNIKSTKVSPEHRINMLRLAIKDLPGCLVDTCGVTTTEAFTALELLQHLRQKFKNASLIYLLGSDVAQRLPAWENWQKLLDYGHLFIRKRSVYALSEPFAIAEFIAQHQVDDPMKLAASRHGHIFISNIPDEEIISSSMVRKCLAEDKSICSLVPATVARYIEQHKLYR